MLAEAKGADIFHALGEELFAAFLGGLVVAASAEGIGEAVHVSDFALFVVGVEVASAVVEFLHEAGGCVAEVEGDGFLAGVFDL